jgi:hypothetical protein
VSEAANWLLLLAAGAAHVAFARFVVRLKFPILSLERRWWSTTFWYFLVVWIGGLLGSLIPFAMLMMSSNIHALILEAEHNQFLIIYFLASAGQWFAVAYPIWLQKGAAR